MNINTKTAWTLLWSHSQQCFHVERLEETFRTNFGCLAQNTKQDYITLMVSEDSDELHRLRLKIDPRKKE